MPAFRLFFLLCLLLAGGERTLTRGQEELPPLNTPFGATVAPTATLADDPRFQGECAECAACDACTACVDCIPCIDCDGLGAVDGCEACASCAPCKPCNDAGCAPCAECLAPKAPTHVALDGDFEEELPALNSALGATVAPTSTDTRFEGECAACAACAPCTECVDCIPCIPCDEAGAVEGCEACAPCAPCKPCNDAGCAPCADCLVPPGSTDALQAASIGGGGMPFGLALSLLAVVAVMVVAVNRNWRRLGMQPASAAPGEGAKLLSRSGYNYLSTQPEEQGLGSTF